MRNLLFLPILMLVLICSVNFSSANVLIENSNSNSRVSLELGFFSGTIDTSAGNEGDYVLFSCAAFNAESSSLFNSPAPGLWTELDEGSCGGGGKFCRHGIWGGFVNTPDNQEITCSWTNESNVFVAGSMRYSNVDPINPIIDVACNTGVGGIAISPSIITEAGSQVIQIFTAGSPTENENRSSDPQIQLNASEENSWLAGVDGIFQVLDTMANSRLVLQDGPTIPDSIPVNSQAEWRACTIALRMAPDLRDVPTMSEWGLISFAAFAGIAGFWFIRRRQLTA